MTRRRKSLPPLSARAPQELRPLIAAMAEIIETGEGIRGDRLDRKITLRDLYDSGLALPLFWNNPGAGMRPPTSPPDMSIPLAPTGFSAIGSFYGFINLTWDVPQLQYRNHAYTNIYRSTEDNFANAMLVGRDSGFFYADKVRNDTLAVEDPTVLPGYYYWITFTSAADVEGPPNSPDGTYAAPLPDLELLLAQLTGMINESVLDQALRSRIESLDAGLAQEILDRVAAVSQEAVERANAIAEEALARGAAIQAEAQERAQAIQSEALQRADEIAQESSDRADAVAGEAAARAAAIQAEAAARTQAMIDEASDRADAIASEAYARAQAIADERQARIAAIGAEAAARATDIQGEVSARNDAIAAEALLRADALAAEAQARAQAISSEQTARADEIAAEAQARAQALAAEALARGEAILEEREQRISEDEALGRRMDGVFAQVNPDMAGDSGELAGNSTVFVGVWSEQYARAAGDMALGYRIDSVSATVETNAGLSEALVYVERQARSDADSALALQLDQLSSTFSTSDAEVRGLIITEREARADENAALASSVDLLSASLATTDSDIRGQIIAERQARADGDAALASDLQAVSADRIAEDAVLRGLVSDESSARISADEVITSRVGLVESQMQASEADILARIASEEDARVNADSALAASRNSLAVQMRGNYSGSDLGQVSTGLLHQERQARVMLGESLVEQISLMSAGVGEQFDPMKIDHFDDASSIWTGGEVVNGWLVPDDGAAPQVQSAAGLGADGSKYGQVRLRVRKVGAPAWAGKLEWKEPDSALWVETSIDEPAYDLNGIGLVTANPGWTGMIDQIRLSLSESQDAANGFSIDWLAIGRPSPGASSAALSEEQQVRAAADLAESLARESLASTLIGDADPDSASLPTLTEGLIYEERQARSAADQVLTNQYSQLSAALTDNDQVVRGLITSEASARASEDAALSGRIDTVGAEIVAADSALRGLITAEATASADRDEVLAGQVNAVLASQEAGDTAIRGLVTQEATARATQDEALARDIDALSVTVSAKDSEVRGLIVAESQARATENEAMTEQLTTLTADVAAKDRAVRGLINTEAGARADADGVIADQLASAIADFATKDAEVRGFIVDESSVRASEDEALSDRITSMGSEFATKDTEVRALISSETDTRTSEFEGLASKVDLITVQVSPPDMAGDEEGLAGDAGSYVGVWSETSARITGDLGLGLRIDSITAAVGDNAASLVAERQARADADAALAGQFTALTSDVADGDAAMRGLISQESTTRSDQFESLSQQLEVLSSEVSSGDAELRGLITTEQQARVTEDEALASELGVLKASVEEGDQEVRGLISNEAQTRASEDGALAEQIGLLDARVTGVNSDIRGLITSEQQARADGDEALAFDLSALAATAANNNVETRGMITAESAVRADGDSALADQLVTLQAHINTESEDIRGLLTSEQEARIDGDEALTQRVDTAVSEFTTKDQQVRALIASESETRATSDAAFASQMDSVLLEIAPPPMAGDQESMAGDASAFVGVWSEMSAFMSADLALGERIDGVSVGLGQNSALLLEERLARADADSALSQLIQTLAVEGEDMRSAISGEAQARTTADEVLAERVDAMSAAIEEDVIAAIQQEASVRADADEALGNRVDAMAVTFGNEISSAIKEESGVRASADDALAQQIIDIQSETEGNTALIRAETQARTDGIAAVTQQIDTMQSTVGENTASLQVHSETIDGLSASHVIKTDVNGYVAGYGLYNDGTTVDFAILADRFWIAAPGTSQPKVNPFMVIDENVYIDSAFIRDASIQEGQLGPISIGKLFDSEGNPITTVGGKIRGEFIEAESLHVASAATFSGDARSTNYVPNVDGWIIRQDGFVEFNNAQIRGNVDLSTLTVNGELPRAAISIIHSAYSNDREMTDSAYANTVTRDEEVELRNIPQGGTLTYNFVNNTRAQIYGVAPGEVKLRSHVAEKHFYNIGDPSGSLDLPFDGTSNSYLSDTTEILYFSNRTTHRRTGTFYGWSTGAGITPPSARFRATFSLTFKVWVDGSLVVNESRPKSIDFTLTPSWTGNTRSAGSVTNPSRTEDAILNIPVSANNVYTYPVFRSTSRVRVQTVIAVSNVRCTGTQPPASGRRLRRNIYQSGVSGDLSRL